MGMRLTAVLTATGGAWLAHCEEVDRAGEGATPDEALSSLRQALAEYFGQAEAVAPPSQTAVDDIEIIVTGAPTGTTLGDRSR